MSPDALKRAPCRPAHGWVILRDSQRKERENEKARENEREVEIEKAENSVRQDYAKEN